MSEVEELERQALALAPEEREALASHLIHSLENVPLDEVDEAWVAEAERRYQDFRSGKVQGVPCDQVFSP